MGEATGFVEKNSCSCGNCRQDPLQDVGEIFPRPGNPADPQESGSGILPRSRIPVTIPEASKYISTNRVDDE